MAARVDTLRVQKGFKKAAGDPALAALAVAVYKKPFTDGLVRALRGTNWVPNSAEYAARKKNAQPWVRTGATLRAISNNAPTRLGTKGKIKVGVNFRNSRAFASPRAFTDSRRRRLPVAKQDQVFNTLKRGGALAKIAENASKRGVGFLDRLAGAFGPSRRDRERAAAGSKGIPARPLFRWRREWEAEMNRDVDAAVSEILRKEGFYVIG